MQLAPVNMTVSATPSNASARWPGASVSVATGPGLRKSNGLGDPIGRPPEFPAVTSDTRGYPRSVQAVRDTFRWPWLRPVGAAADLVGDLFTRVWPQLAARAELTAPVRSARICWATSSRANGTPAVLAR